MKVHSHVKTVYLWLLFNKPQQGCCTVEGAYNCNLEVLASNHVTNKKSYSQSI